MRRLVFLLLASVIAMPVFAEEKGWTPELVSPQEAGGKPALRHPPRLDPLAGPEVRLTPKEAWSAASGKRWADGPDLPARGADGGVVFPFGGALPVIVCAPLYVCDLSLQPGEAVNDLHLGDAVRWQIAPATQGVGAGAITHLIIKPTDIGLITNLVITTDRRAYAIKREQPASCWTRSSCSPSMKSINFSAFNRKRLNAG
jgi:hypothetical protein